MFMRSGERTVTRDIKDILSDQSIDWETFRSSNVLVTGATGLIGSLFIRTLLANNHKGKVFAVVRDLSKAKSLIGEDVVWITGNIRDPIVLPGEHIDYILHAASITSSRVMVESPVETLLTAIEGTRNALDLAVEKKVKGFLYLSSMEVYGTVLESQNPITEEKMGFVDISSPRSSYPGGKRACELLVNSYYHQYGVPVRVARLAQTFGAGVPMSDQRMSMQFAKSVVEKKDIVLHTLGKSISNVCYTADVIKAIFVLLQKGKDGEAYNVCNASESRSVEEIAHMVAEKVSGGTIGVIFDISPSNDFGYAPDSVMRMSADKIKSLGWAPSVNLEEGYIRLVEYIEECENV